MIAGGVAMMVINGLKGMNKASDWHVDGLSGFIGGFLGGTESGWKGTVENMVPGALTGAGIGLMFGPIGLIVGGLLGAAVGAILGYIGGEEIAKTFQSAAKTGNQLVTGIGNVYSGKSTYGDLLGADSQGVAGGLSNRVLGMDISGPDFADTLVSANKNGDYETYMDLLKKNGGKDPQLEKMIMDMDSALTDPTNKRSEGMTYAIGSILEHSTQPSVLDFKKKFGIEDNNAKTIQYKLRSGKIALKSSDIDDLDSIYVQAHGAGARLLIRDGIITSKEDYEALKQNSMTDAELFDKARKSKYGHLPGRSSVQDAIITKSGQIIHTDPDDNLYAFKNIPDLNKGGAAGSRANGNFAQYEKASQFDEKSLDRLGDKIIEAMKSIQPNVVSQQTNNYSDRFSSDNLLNSITMEVR